MIRAGTWVRPTIEPNWNETEPRKPSYQRKGNRAPEKNRVASVRSDFRVTQAELHEQLSRWTR